MPKTEKQLLLENQELRANLTEAEETLNAIRNGEVDAIIVSGLGGEKIFSISSAETPYRVIIEEMNDGAVVLSAEGVVLYCNRRFAELVSIAPEQIVGSWFIQLFKKNDIQKFKDLLQAGIKGKTNGELTYIKDDNTNPIHLHLSFSPLPPELLGDVCIMATDISELKQKTDNLELSYKELEAFSYSISHDLRAPLRHIGGFIDLLMKSNSAQLDDTGIRYLNTITESAKEMGKLIDALLSFSKLGRTGLQVIEFNTKDMVKKVLKSFEDELSGRNIEINLSELPKTKGDVSLINQVWVNLISNAIKYTRNREKAVIEIGGKIENGETIFHIMDNGVGFDMKYAENLFGVFHRMHNATDFEGIGIGLANVNRIVMKHGGKCWAESEVDKGATFFFSLPIN